MSDATILKAALFTPGPRGLWGQPMRIVGGPGTAKTDIITQVATLAGLRVVVVLASLRDPTDFLGMPVVREGRVSYAPPDWVLEVTENPNAVVFFDEINLCAPSTQAALLRVVLDRVVGNHSLPPTVRILAAQNGVDEAAGGYDLAMPLANRFGTLTDWTGPGVEDWSAWLVGQSSGSVLYGKVSDSIAEQERVMAAWPLDYAKATGVISAFIRRKPSLLHAQPQAGSPQASLPWPSRRTWAMATRALAASKIHNLTEAETDRYVGSFVGQAAMVELQSFITNLDLPDPEELLDGIVSLKHNKSRLDRTMAALSACASLVLPKDAHKRSERAAMLWKIVRDVMKDASDIVWPTVKLLCSRDANLARVGEVINKDADVVLTKFQPMLKEANLLTRTVSGT
jgi:hypothetical protein